MRESTNALRVCRYALNYKAKRTLYYALFNSHLEYGAYCYQDKLNKSQWQKITKLQKQCIRIIFNAKNTTHTAKLFKLSGITPAEKTYQKEAIKLVYKSTTELYQPNQPPEIAKLLL